MADPKAHGPDISHWQTIAGPRDPAWVLGAAKCSEGQRSGDKMFRTHWDWLEGVRYRGAYHWLRSDSTIASQAANLVARVREANGGPNLLPGDFLQCDWEVTPGIPLVTAEAVVEFCDRVRQTFGEDCVIVYSSDWLPDSTLDADSLREFLEWRWSNPNHPLWYANYNLGSSPTGGRAECLQYGADVWQWTSKYLHPAISSGGFDMNEILKFPTLERICRRTPVVVPPPTIPPQPPKPPTIITLENDMQAFDPAPRIYDTRQLGAGSALAPLVVRAIPVQPAARFAMVNLTVVNAAGAGHLQAWGAGDTAPVSSVVNFQASGAIANSVLVPVVDGVFKVRATQAAHLVVDLQAVWP